jgi:FAD/FMN-containing dehydrogenase
MTRTAMRTPATDLDALRVRLTGAAVGPDDEGYDDLRRVWNGASDDRRPAVIVRCGGDEDVSAALAFARTAGLEVTVRGGAHSTPGASVADGAVTIHLGGLDTVTVDPGTRTALVGGGATLAALDAATTAHGLAVPTGLISHTGIGGLTLGGGLGWLSRKFGLALDNVRAVRIVTADGRVRRAAADEHPDLFWAVRGGGGSFGVVTEFEFALHPVDPVVQVGMFFWPLDRAADGLRLARAVTADLPEQLNAVILGMNAPLAPFVPEPVQGTPGVALVLVGFDGTDEFAGCAERLRSGLPPLFELVSPMPYTALQQLFDAGNEFGVHAYEKGVHLADLGDDAIGAIARHLSRKPSPLSVFVVHRMDGAFSAVPEDATAWGGGRSPRYTAFVLGVTPEPAGLAAERAWVRGFADALEPYALEAGTHANLVEVGDEPRVRATYGATFDRLARVKAEYDPQDVFHHRHAGIRRPAPA